MACISLMLSLAVLWFQAYLPPYWQHLAVDTRVYFDRVDYATVHHTLHGIPFNEYQPGAILYFSLLYPFVASGINVEEFTQLFFGLNSVTTLVMGYWLWVTHQRRGLLVLSTMLLFGGPIILFRFELWVALVTIWALTRIRNNQVTTGCFWLGAASAIKIYPVILLPIAILMRPQAWYRLLAGFLAGLGFVLGIYMVLFGATPADIWHQALVHTEKPINLESIQSGALEFTTYLTSGTFLPIDCFRIVWGLSRGTVPYPEPVGHYVWLLPYGIWLFWLAFHRRKLKPHTMIIAAATLSQFLVFTSQLAPQYLFWPLLLLPYIADIPIGLVLVAGIILGLSQWIYPLHYLDLIGSIDSNRLDLVVILLWLRNGCLILFAGWLTRLVFSRLHKPHAESYQR